ncbi:hypothetical protein [Pseudomonas sp. UMAB-40]|uniref:hypothetical protein n=1 Tax=Pseudomonas sp. UMAB-40 TaxID=1365407 RepID=UPI001C59FEF6|nr:hypothetical protein [Pseudomonas sp. UMAB-40]
MTDFKHEPLKRIREDVAGEGIFVRLWQELMLCPIEEHSRIIVTPSNKLGEIMMYSPVEVTQRTASICAEFCRYLGTNGGRSYLQLLDELSRVLGSRERGACAAWALENERCFGTNGGRRTIEFLLSSVWGETANPADISYEDVEAVDTMANWLGTKEGENFVAIGLRMIDEDYQRKRAAERDTFWNLHHPIKIQPPSAIALLR